MNMAYKLSDQSIETLLELYKENPKEAKPLKTEADLQELGMALYLYAMGLSVAKKASDADKEKAEEASRRLKALMDELEAHHKDLDLEYINSRLAGNR